MIDAWVARVDHRRMRASTRTIRFAVGTALVALGGACTSKPDGPGSNVGEVRDPKAKTPETKTPETKIPDTKIPEPAPEEDHVNVGPADDPKDPDEPITKDPPPTKTPEPTKILPTANPGPGGR